MKVTDLFEAKLTTADFDLALGEVNRAMRANDPNPSRSWAEWRGFEDRPYNQQGREFSVRDWGVWENPPEARNEEDYDWQRPTKKTVDTLAKIIKDVQKRHKKVELHFSVEEKNWIYVSAEPKQRKAKPVPASV